MPVPTARTRIRYGAVAAIASALVLSGCGSAPVAELHARAVTAARCTPATPSQIVAGWPLRRLVLQTVTVPVAETNVGAVSAQVAAGVGGVILFGGTAPAGLGDDLRRLVQRAPAGIVPAVMTDEEGGLVQRMANLVGSMPSPRQMARTMTTQQVTTLADHVAARMRAAQVTMNLAPVLDLDDRPGPSATNPDGTRSFSIDPSRTTAYGLAFAQGMVAGGVVPVVKHFPGLGRATANTDEAPAWTQPWSTLRKKGLRPFRAAVRAGLPAVMTSTARVPGLSRTPAALSHRVVTGVLRHQLGFDGLVITDSLSGVAVRAAGFSVPQASVQALKAGDDLILFNALPGDVGPVTSRIVHAVLTAVRQGKLSRGRVLSAAEHVLAAKGAGVCP
jgi:beta-N-acetylhexosaminidase